MPWKTVLSELSQAVRNNVDKITMILPENMTTRSNAVKTVDLLVDVHQSSKDPKQGSGQDPSKRPGQRQAGQCRTKERSIHEFVEQAFFCVNQVSLVQKVIWLSGRQVHLTSMRPRLLLSSLSMRFFRLHVFRFVSSAFVMK